MRRSPSFAGPLHLSKSLVNFALSIFAQVSTALIRDWLGLIVLAARVFITSIVVILPVPLLSWLLKLIIDFQLLHFSLDYLLGLVHFFHVA